MSSATLLLEDSPQDVIKKIRERIEKPMDSFDRDELSIELDAWINYHSEEEG